MRDVGGRQARCLRVEIADENPQQHPGAVRFIGPGAESQRKPAGRVNAVRAEVVEPTGEDRWLSIRQTHLVIVHVDHLVRRRPSRRRILRLRAQSQRVVDRDIGGIQVAFQVGSGTRQSRRDLVETKSGLILRQQDRQVAMDPEEVMHRVLILDPIESSADDATIASLLERDRLLQTGA